MDAHSYDQLISDFYRSATGALAWEDSLESLRTTFDARAAEIDTIDVPTRTLHSVRYSGPNLDQCALDYVREFHGINPRSRVHQKLAMGQWMHCHEHFDDRFVTNDRFYTEFVPAYDMRFASGMMFPIDERTIGIIALLRGHGPGPVNAQERVWLERLGEHLRQAILAYQRVRAMAAQALAGHKLLSVFPYPMWLVDADRFVLFANPAAVREMQVQERFVEKGVRLCANNPKIDRALTEKITGLSGAGHLASSVVDLRFTESDPPTWLHLSLLVPGDVLGAFGQQPQILATLFDPASVSYLDPFALANIFRFTPAEAKVATQVAEGIEPDRIAEANGTRISTVRSQISNILAKLGGARQADIVRILRQGEALWAKAPH